MIKKMQKGSVVVDVAIDQGGCFETSKPTTHADPTYIVDDVVHYCVTNMPGAVGRTSTFALCNVTLPWILRLADGDLKGLVSRYPEIGRAVNITDGLVTNRAVAETFDLPYEALFEI